MEPSKRFSSCYRCAEWCSLFHFSTLLTIKQWINTLLSPFKRITWWNKNNVTLCHVDQELINLRIEPAVTYFLVVSSLYQLSLSQQVRLGSLVLESKAIKGESQAPNVMYTPHSYFSYSWVTLSLSIKKTEPSRHTSAFHPVFKLPVTVRAKCPMSGYSPGASNYGDSKWVWL